MPLSEEEKRNLINDGKFTPSQINLFERVQISYDNVKRIQDLLMRYTTQENQRETPPTLTEINDMIENDLQTNSLLTNSNGIVDEETISTYIYGLEDGFEADIINESDEDYNSDEQSIGGRKRRKSRKSKSRKSRKSRKSKRKKSRRFSRKR
jgi:hypothetical protein